MCEDEFERDKIKSIDRIHEVEIKSGFHGVIDELFCEGIKDYMLSGKGYTNEQSEAVHHVWDYIKERI